MSAPATPIELLHRIERSLRIFEPSIEEFSLWPLMRLRAWQLLSGIEPRTAVGSAWRHALRRPGEFMRLPYAAWSIVQRRRLRGRRFDFAFLSSEAYRSVKREDGWWDVYLDDIARHPALHGRVLRCEIRAFAISPLRTPAPRHLFTDAQLFDQILGGLVSRDGDAEKQAQTLVAHFREELDRLDCPLDDAQLAGFERYGTERAKMFRRSLRWYAALLEQFRPRALVLTDAYNQHGAVAGARRHGIPVIEFQHGVINDGHPGYIWPKDALAMRDRLPIPTHIATYGDYWSNILTAAGFWEPDRIRSVGSTRMDWLRGRSTQRSGPRDEVRMVFTTQHPTRARAVTLFRGFIELAQRAGVPFRLVVKVHRMETAFIQEYRGLAERSSAVTVLSAYQGDTLSRIAEADVHVSAWSTCHYEALGLGVPTVVLALPGPHVRLDLDRFSGVMYASSAEELLECVKWIRQHGGEPEQSATDASNALFKPGAVAGAVEFIEKVAIPEPTAGCALSETGLPP